MFILLGVQHCKVCEGCNKFKDTVHNMNTYILCTECLNDIDNFSKNFENYLNNQDIKTN